jgi:hypothetical protein
MEISIWVNCNQTTLQPNERLKTDITEFFGLAFCGERII